MLPKRQDMVDLQARIDCLLKVNSDLKNKVIAKEAQLKEVQDPKEKVTTLEAELTEAWKERDEAAAIFRTFQGFVGKLFDIVNKAQLYDENRSQPRASSRLSLHLRSLGNLGKYYFKEI